MSTHIKKHQFRALCWTIGILISILGMLAWLGHQSSKEVPKKQPKYQKHSLASPLSSKSSEAHWIEKTQNAWRAQQKKSEQVEQHLKSLGEDKAKQLLKLHNQEETLNALKSELARLHEEMNHIKETSTRAASTPSVNQLTEQSNSLIAADSGFIQYSAKLSKNSQPRIKTPQNYVFSNTFAKAIVLQGADASAGVLSQSNPDVMIFQIIEDGIMPNQHRVALKGCLVSASVVGDISSERGKLRTERLSCIHPDGTSIDTQVTGIVSDSKNGIRGRPVWRDGPMARKAFWGNFWQSMGGIGQQYATDYKSSAFGPMATIQPAKIPLAAVSQGGAGSAKMYAQYTIKRAELYHPVIQLDPETIGDITFLKGFWLDGGTDKEAPLKEEQTQPPEAQAAKQFFYKNHSF